MSKKIAVLVGSLRKDSLNRKVAKALIKLAPKSLELEIVEIGQLQLFNDDLDNDNNRPVEWTKFRDKIRGFDGLLFITPEYNRSMSGVLKNAIDVGSRPYDQSVWSGKPGAVVSVSMGHLGGFGAYHHLRQILSFLDVPAMAQPEAYVSDAASLFDDAGNLVSESKKESFTAFMAAFAKWVERNC